MNVFSSLKPHAMMSRAFLKAKSLTCSILRLALKRNFSSSVSWMTSGQSNTPGATL